MFPCAWQTTLSKPKHKNPCTKQSITDRVHSQSQTPRRYYDCTCRFDNNPNHIHQLALDWSWGDYKKVNKQRAKVKCIYSLRNTSVPNIQIKKWSFDRWNVNQIFLGHKSPKYDVVPVKQSHKEVWIPTSTPSEKVNYRGHDLISCSFYMNCTVGSEEIYASVWCPRGFCYTTIMWR